MTIFHSGISAASIAAVLLNLFYNVFRPGTPQDPSLPPAAPAVLVNQEELDVLDASGSMVEGEPVDSEGRPITAGQPD